MWCPKKPRRTERKNLVQPVTLRVRVIDTRDATVREQSSVLAPATFAKNRTANLRMPIATAGLPAGRYSPGHAAIVAPALTIRSAGRGCPASTAPGRLSRR